MVRVPFPSIAAALALLALAAGLASCRGTEEDTSQLATEEPTAGMTATPEVTQVAPSPSSTPEPRTATPAQSVTFYDSNVFGEATFQYPTSWYRDSAGGIHSSNPAEWPSVCRPDGAMGIQVSALPTGEVPREKGAIDFSLGASTGWELVEQNTEDCPGLAHTVVLESAGLSYIFIFISDSVEQEPVFQQILASLKLPG